MNNNIQKYTTYKPSGVEWLGEIPEHWEVKKLKFILKFSTGGTPSSQVSGLYSGDEPWVTISDMDGKYIDKTHFISKRGVKVANIPVTKKGSLLYSFKLSVGQVAFTNKDIYTNEAIATFYPQKSVNLNFWYYLLPIFVVKNANTNIYGAFLLNQDLIKNSFLLLPPLTEQTRIAEFLDRKTAQIDQAVTIKEKQIALLKERRQILIHRAVTRGINPDVKLKPSGVEWIGDIPEHWEVKKLRYVGKCQNGVSKGGEYFGSGFPFISYGDVYKNIELPKIANGLAESTEADRKQYSVKEGDIFFTRTSETVEEIAFASTCKETIDNATFSGFLIRFRPTKGFLWEGFSKYYFSSYTHRAFFIKEMNLVIRASLSQELLNRMPILIPPLDEQNIIAEHIENISEKIATAINLKQQEIEKLKEYKSTLINSAVTGKIRV